MKHKRSPSQIATYRLCPRKWAFSRVLGSRSNAYAQDGTAVHSILENWLQHGTLIDTRTRHGQIASSGLEHLPPPGVCAVESAFVFESAATIYNGLRDLRYYDKKEKIEVIGDHKTTVDLKWAKTPEDLATDPQGVLYAMSVFEEAPLAKQVELRWIYYKTREPYKSKLVKLRVTYEETLERMKEIESTAAEMSQHHAVGELPEPEKIAKNPTACEAFGGCPYQSECGITAAERMRSIMSQSAAQTALQAKLQAKIAARGQGTAVQAIVEEERIIPVATGPVPTPVAESVKDRLARARAAKEAPQEQGPSEATREEMRERTEAALAKINAASSQNKLQEIAEELKNKAQCAGTETSDLRDHFAMSALNALIVRNGVTEASVTEAYRVADAMLKARSK